jgi:SAM-dependent methyltransferase
MLKALLCHPHTRGLDIDDPRTTELRRTIVREKPFLRKVYEEWYSQLAVSIPNRPEYALELGSGAGFLDEFVPRLITSEIFPLPGIQLVSDATLLPFGNASLRAITMVDVLHHIPDPGKFLHEASRCLLHGGVIAMIEPWVTSWSKLVYKNLHHEPFEPDAAEWTIPIQGPLSGANGAIPWIIFQRDRQKFEAEFPELRIESIQLTMPFRYMVSGGVSMRDLMPHQLFPVWKAFEKSLSAWMPHLAMFALIVVVKR